MISSIRPARPEEAGALSALAFRSKAHWGYSTDFMDACRDELTVDSSDIEQGNVFVRTSGPTVVGLYCLEALDADRVELGLLFVEPDQIGHGHGRALIEHARQEAKRRGFRTIVIQGDPNAEAFYTAAGAEQVGTRASASIPGRTLPVFELRLG